MDDRERVESGWVNVWASEKRINYQRNRILELCGYVCSEFGGYLPFRAEDGSTEYRATVINFYGYVKKEK